MSQTRMLLVIGALVAVGLAAALWVWSGKRADQPALVTEAATIPLYFPAEQGWVAEESRQIADLPQDDDARAARVVSELLAGPTTDGLYPLLPAGTEVDVAHLEDDGTCVIEFLSTTFARPPDLGSRQEAELYASLLTSLSANLTTVEKVVLLWNGRQPESFGGHLDTTRPLGIDAAQAVAQ